MNLHRRLRTRNLFLTLLVLEMVMVKFGIKADLIDFIRDSPDRYDVTARNQLYVKSPPAGANNGGLQHELIRCSLHTETTDRKECELRLWLLDLIHQHKQNSNKQTHKNLLGGSYRAKVTRSSSEDKSEYKVMDSVNNYDKLKAAIPLEYITVIENCIHKCDVWSSRVNYYNCMKSCKRENKIIQSLEDMPYDDECHTWPCDTDSDRKPIVKRQSGCSDGECISPDQPRKRRWGDTLTTCIHSYCNSFSGVSRVDCIINKCDKQRRG